MASFFSNSENERDTSAVLQMRESLSGSYSEGLLPGNMIMYMNYPSSAGSYSSMLPVNIQQQNSCIAAMPGATNSNPSHQEILSEMGNPRIGGDVLSEWKDNRSNLLLMHSIESAAGVYQGAQNLQGQGLSLTLGTHAPPGFQMSSFDCQTADPGLSSLMCSNHAPDTDRSGPLGNDHYSPNQQSRGFEYLPSGVPVNSFGPMRSDASTYGMLSSTKTVPSSKYLKAAQDLLDEVVNVKAALKEQTPKIRLMKDSTEGDVGQKIGDADPTGSGSSPKQQDSSSNSAPELSAAEKQELQNKLTKLLEMLDEVDRRYKQYYHQMQIMVSSFDTIAGFGASMPYTALALQTISRHFRCLRDAISEQIQVTRKGLGEQDASGSSKGVGISRLRFIDQHIRQRRAIQQLGTMQQHAWRPQRGLPESSVTVLRAWLFEHFLHPYPKDSEKMMLARQTGLTRSQVSNWFINARVRLWKPMVEDMYKEEIGDAELDANSPTEYAAKAISADAKASEDRGDDLQQNTTSTSAKYNSTGQTSESRSGHLADAQLDSNVDNSFQKMSHFETESAYGLAKVRASQRPGMNGCNMLSDSALVQSNEGSARMMAAASAAYHISELETFEEEKGVSLTLGLQQCQGNSIPMSMETHHGYATMREDGMYSMAAPSIGPEAGEFDCLDSENRHHHYSSAQLLHDFVT